MSRSTMREPYQSYHVIRTSHMVCKHCDDTFVYFCDCYLSGCVKKGS